MFWVYRLRGTFRWVLEKECSTYDKALEELDKWDDGYIGFQGKVIHTKGNKAIQYS